MRQIRTILCALLLLCVLLPTLPASLAEEPERAEDPGERFADKSWDELVEEFLQNWKTDPKNVAIGYYNTVTGEEHYVNPDESRITASMYKVPLNMVFLDRLSRGEMDWDTKVAGYPYETVLEQTIVHSNNDIARSMIKWELGNGNWQEGRRALAPYCGLDAATVDWKFRENNYSTPRQMIYCLRLLYENPDRFPRLVETMQRAEPEEYFKRREQRFEIAHKYGFLQTDDGHLYINDCGIAFTDEPILLVMFTDNNLKAYDVLTEFCTLMCDYSQYHHAQRLEAERLEAERLEAERLEAERLEAERLEAERLEAERLEAEEERARAARENEERQSRGETLPPAESAAPAAEPETEAAPAQPGEERPAAEPETEEEPTLPGEESPAPALSESGTEPVQSGESAPELSQTLVRIVVLGIFGLTGLCMVLLIVIGTIRRFR